MKSFWNQISASGNSSGYKNPNGGHYGTPKHDRFYPDEGAGRSSWDFDQNRVYGDIFGNSPGPSTYVENGRITHFRGKGPKNYRRPDELILEDINERLFEDYLIDASNIEVSVKEGEVILSGYVENKSAKRRAEDLTEDVSGVRHLENRLRMMQHR
jgi:hypothetical protein